LTAGYVTHPSRKISVLVLDYHSNQGVSGMFPCNFHYVHCAVDPDQNSSGDLANFQLLCPLVAAHHLLTADLHQHGFECGIPHGE
jgi:hypothetical protein